MPHIKLPKSLTSRICSSRPNRLFSLVVVLFTILISNNSNAFEQVKTNNKERSSITVEQGTFIVEKIGAGKPLILIPGLMSSGKVYTELAADLSKTYQVHVVSVKGFAGTPQTGSFSLNQFVGDIVAYIEVAKLNKPSIVGHSMGGLTAFKLASEHADKIGRVVSIDGLPFIGPIFTRSNATTADMLKPQAHNMKTMFANMTAEQMAGTAQQGVFIQATSEHDQARVVEMARASDPATAGDALFDVMLTDLREPLKRTTTPILMLGASGAFTQTAQHAQVEALYAAQFAEVPNATVVMNTKIRHFMMFDDLAWTGQQIEKFLGSK
ncbi:MAG: N-formylmaleamate deformylase [Kangiellaceae bacterium]|jgi:pimeloyl-ACP methyl ester carboxylesterase